MVKHLTPRRIRFCEEYARDCNATQAAIRAGYSPRSAPFDASRALRDPMVQAEIHKHTRRISEAADVTARRVLEELARLAFSDLGRVVRVEGGRVVVADTDTLTPDQRAAVASVGQTEAGIKVSLHDKTKALELLGRYLALFTDRTEVSGAPDAPLVMVMPPEKP